MNHTSNRCPHFDIATANMYLPLSTCILNATKHIFEKFRSFQENPSENTEIGIPGQNLHIINIFFWYFYTKMYQRRRTDFPYSE